MEEKELTCPACRHTAKYMLPEGMDAQCEECGVEIDLIPGIQTYSSEGRVQRGVLPVALQKFVKTRVEDIDDDPDDDHFLVPEVKKQKMGGALRAFLDKRVEDIDDDPDDDHFLVPEETKEKSTLKKLDE